MVAEASLELVVFILIFLAAGAVGFRYAVLGKRLADPSLTIGEMELFGGAGSRAAMLGLIGSIGTLLLLFARNLPRSAARQHLGVMQYLMGNPLPALQALLAIVAVIGFGLAMSRVPAGWFLALVAVVGSPISPLFFGRWTPAINPIHRLAGGLWIGTLFVLVVCGLGPVLRASLDPLWRGNTAANMVHSFSPLALGSFFVLSFTGVNTAWIHLKHLNALWTTAYGYTLIAKLCVVAVVVGLGAFNWRKQRPLLGTEGAAASLRRSAVAELAAATVVLIITAVLVSLPSPR